MKKLLGILLFLTSSMALALNSGLLFLQSATQGELIKNKDKNYSLTLRDVPAYVGYFTDRPKRQAGTLPLTQFIELWSDKNLKNNFSAVPPNAAIAMIATSGKPQNFIAIISNPHYIEKGTVTYQLNILSKKSILTGSMEHINLFFDEIHWNPGGF
ncbi:Uncharacterised protein [Legionella beliardensis]|uniref:Uncharacterized protein n=1 Tax=Legionella beliardensis TaxID=91822 RepID=A0A378I1L1_9GAMM|nr:hypothetical protein [Legionella beliardensis]STX28565.1 Uncharacterised protein [Legionella beliardensis]